MGTEVAAQGWQDTPPDRREPGDIGVGHLFDGYTENHDPMPKCECKMQMHCNANDVMSMQCNADDAMQLA